MMDTKWLAVMVIGIALIGGLSSCWISYSRSLEARAALENGYMQTVDEATGQVLWVPAKD